MVARLYCQWLKLAGTLQMLYEVMFNLLGGAVVSTCLCLGYWVKNGSSAAALYLVVELLGYWGPIEIRR